MFITLDLGVIINISTFFFGKDTYWQKQHGNWNPTVRIPLLQLPTFKNNSLNHIWGQSNARGGVAVRVLFSFFVLAMYGYMHSVCYGVLPMLWEAR